MMAHLVMNLGSKALEHTAVLFLFGLFCLVLFVCLFSLLETELQPSYSSEALDVCLFVLFLFINPKECSFPSLTNP